MQYMPIAKCIMKCLYAKEKINENKIKLSDNC